MAQRTVALCNGKYIGIETIFTVIDGKQINIKGKVEELRAKSRNNELVCPCGCGTILTLVAGENNLREQHFRERSGTGKYKCTMPTEGLISVDSKIVLKCWLDDKLHAGDIESRVPIQSIEKPKRHPEFTFLSRENKLGIRYWKNSTSFMDEKLDVLSGNFSGIRVIYIVDCSNGGSVGQYPESLMKLQNRQGYCLLLEIEGADYAKAKIQAVFYAKNIDGLWAEQEISSAKLSDVNIIANELYFNGVPLTYSLPIAKEKFRDEQNKEIERREEIRLRREAYRFQDDFKSLINGPNVPKRNMAENPVRSRINDNDKKISKEETRRKEEFRQNLDSYLSRQDKPVRDPDGNRWIKCEICGRKAQESEFISYGGPGRINLGICKECHKKQPTVEKNIMLDESMLRKQYNSNICPECGGKLRERNGRYGKFYGCENYPRCRYTRIFR